MAKQETMKIQGAELADFAKWRQSATAEARKLLAPQIAEALNLQTITVNDSIKLKVVGADGKNQYKDQDDAGKFWPALVTIAEKGKELNIPASVLVAAVNEELGNPDTWDTRAATAKAYRITFGKVAGLYLSPNYDTACKLVGKDNKGEFIACDKSGHALPLHRLSYATARKAFTVFGKTDHEREFARQIQLFVQAIKEASRNQAKNEKDGKVAMSGVPLDGETGLIATLETLRGMIPERTVVKSAATASEPQADMGAAADEGEPEGVVELGQVANG